MTHFRRRGTVIVDTRDGILVVSETGNRYSLPGGNAREGESRKKAAIRELREETCLLAKECIFLLKYYGSRKHKDVRGGYFRTVHKVFLTKAYGVAKPHGEIKYISYFNGLSLNLHDSTRKIIEKYQKIKNFILQVNSTKNNEDS